MTVGADGCDKIIEGFYACGEAACVSVHGANRLGGNSLLDLVVFGRASGLFIENALRDGIELGEPTKENIETATIGLNALHGSAGGEKASTLRAELQTIMQNFFGVFRRGDLMRDGIIELQSLKHRIDNVALDDKSMVFNTARIEALELRNLYAVAEATAITAEALSLIHI